MLLDISITTRDRDRNTIALVYPIVAAIWARDSELHNEEQLSIKAAERIAYLMRQHGKNNFNDNLQFIQQASKRIIHALKLGIYVRDMIQDRLKSLRWDTVFLASLMFYLFVYENRFDLRPFDTTTEFIKRVFLELIGENGELAS